MCSNPHFESSVRIQKDRNHQVVTTGPYRFVRHPGYAAGVIGISTYGLVLGSGISYGAIAIAAMLFVWRTAREDALLHRDLEGYAEYAARVKYRLVPGVW